MTEEFKVSKFNGATTDDYSLWRLRLEALLDPKGYLEKLENASAMEEDPTKLAIFARRSAPLRVCWGNRNEPLLMLEALDKR